MEHFNLEENWELGQGGLNEVPYFDMVVGYYHFIREDQLHQIVQGQIGLVDGRLAVVYGFTFTHTYPVRRG